MNQNKYKIAVIDDETEILQMINRFLQKKDNYNVTTFSNPLNALDQVDSSFDLVLLDIMMPQMNGIEVLEKLLKKNPTQKVIMMTAYSTLDRVLKSHKNGATHYIMKPFESLMALENKIIEVLES